MRRALRLNRGFFFQQPQVSIPDEIVDIPELIVLLDASDPERFTASGSWNNLGRNPAYQHPGIFNGGAHFVSSMNQERMCFDGYDDYVAVFPNGGELDFYPNTPGNEITLEAWVRTTDVRGDGDRAWLAKPFNDQGEYSYLVTHNKLSYRAQSNPPRELSFASIATGEWEHIAIVMTPTQWGVYRNGIVDVPMTNHNISGTGPVRGIGTIGVNNIPRGLVLMNNYPFYQHGGQGWSVAGQLNTFRLYRKALTSGEIAQNYNATKNRFVGVSRVVLDLDAGNLSSYPGSGSAWTDLSENQFVGTILSGGSYSTDGGGSIELDGAQVIEFPDNDLYRLESFTMDVWFKRTANWNPAWGADVLLASDVGPGYYQKWALSYDSASSKFTFYGGEFQQPGAGPGFFLYTDNTFNISNNTWYNLTLTKEGTQFSFYVDGVLLSSVSGPQWFSVLPDVPAPLKIGHAEGSGTRFQGRIAKVKIEDKARSGAEILAEHNSLKSRFGLDLEEGSELIVNLDASDPASYPGTGSTWFDLTNIPQNANLFNSPTFNAADAESLVFNGSNQYAEIDAPRFLQGGVPFSLELWAKWSTTGTTIATIKTLVDNNHYHISDRGFVIQDRPDLGGVLTFSTNAYTNGAATSSVVGNGTWRHIVATWDGQTSKIYIDGVLEGSLIQTASTSIAPIVTLGRWEYGAVNNVNQGAPPGRYFGGQIAAFKLYSKSLSAQEALDNFNGSKSRFGL